MVKKTSIKTNDLRGKTKEDLQKQLDELKKELYQLRVQKVTGGQTSNLLNIKGIKKSISRTLNVLTERQRSGVKKAFENKKRLPLDLRPKGTRAFRRALKPYQAKARVARVIKRNNLFPQRRFAVVA